jgi:hypothetical protein
VIKDARLLAVLDYLWQRLGASAFETEDHWEADLLATGVKNPDNPNALAYIALSGEDHFTVIIEAGRAEGSHEPSKDIGTFECDAPEDVCLVIQDFLAIQSKHHA